MVPQLARVELLPQKLQTGISKLLFQHGARSLTMSLIPFSKHIDMLGETKDSIQKKFDEMPFFFSFHKSKALIEFHLMNKNCKRFELQNDGWHSWNLDCANGHVTTLAEDLNPQRN